MRHRPLRGSRLGGVVLTIWMFRKIGVSPKMDGENNGKPYFLMDDSGGNPRFSETSIYFVCVIFHSESQGLCD